MVTYIQIQSAPSARASAHFIWVFLFVPPMNGQIHSCIDTQIQIQIHLDVLPAAAAFSLHVAHCRWVL